ncbi:hypothetical protein QJS04_geneDACA005003 [Acorus gramineus]|uniref:Uncharacterized protein n=1 Tax=Acorus gramineus TaxID=55184 RepID=A0AAV9AWW1_ACOGR|nr:hypothetical protein QJS04_geneDACA005003 [Acorus gramineus]
MGAYGTDRRIEAGYGFQDSRSPWNVSSSDAAAMAAGQGGIGNLVDRFSGLGVNDSSKESIVQVFKAVEAAENTIKQQVEENKRLKDELERKTEELERYKSDPSTSQRVTDGLSGDPTPGSYGTHRSASPVGNKAGRVRWMDPAFQQDPQGALVIHQNGMPENEEPSLQPTSGSWHYPENGKMGGPLKPFPGGQSSMDNVGFSQFPGPSSRPLPPSVYQKEEYDPRLNSGNGLMPVPEINNSSSLWKQDLGLKIREHEEEIVQLRKHLAEYSVKEAQIRNEKYVLEKRIAYMRMAFDQQQQELVDAASKALSYRQEIIEENIRLTYALQAAQQERTTFVSSLMPLLSEYGLQLSVLDAQSIVSNLKVLFKHLQEKLTMTEEKLKESQYQIAPWRPDTFNTSNFAPQSPSHTFGAPLNVSNNKGLEIVPQGPYSQAHTPISSPSNAQTTRADWDVFGNPSNHTISAGAAPKNLDHENLGRSSPSSSRNSAGQEATFRGVATQDDPRIARFSEESKNQNPSFKDLARGSETDDSETGAPQRGVESSVNWGSTPYLTPGLDEPSTSFSPYLPPVLEEPSSSFSEAADDDPLPAIEDLQISGQPFPGRELQACGYSIHGTTSCNFEWVRHLEDGSVFYIDGAKQPKYLVTADDVDSYLAIEVQPLDDRKRKGELVKVFANEQRKITCDPEMQEQIERVLSIGNTSYQVSLSAGVLDIWERAILAIKREGYSIKCDGPRGVVVTEKFHLNTNISVPYGQPTEFVIQSSSGYHVLRTTDSSLRDGIVLTMRLFSMRAVEKRKGKKRLFFNK